MRPAAGTLSALAAERVRGFGTSVFAEMSALARKHDAVNLGQGFPDFEGPTAIRDAALQAIREGHNQYAASTGERVLREAIAAHAARFYGQQIDPAEEVTVTTGATEGLWSASMAFIEPGDEVIVFEPFYDAYVPNCRMAGGIPVAVTLHAPEFRFDPDELRAAFTPRTKAIFVNTPHNPTGTLFNEEELALIADLCQRYDVLAIADEVYEHITFDGHRHLRLSTFPGMWDRTLTLSSAGKSFSFTGWKVGWAIGPAPLQRALRQVHQFTVFATATPLQYAAAAALGLPESYYESLAADYQRRRDFLVAAVAESGMTPTVPRGTYFLMAGIEGVTDKDAVAYSRELIERIGLAVIPPATFYMRPEHGAHLVRFCFCKKWETLEAAAGRLARLSA